MVWKKWSIHTISLLGKEYMTCWSMEETKSCQSSLSWSSQSNVGLKKPYLSHSAYVYYVVAMDHTCGSFFLQLHSVREMSKWCAQHWKSCSIWLCLHQLLERLLFHTTDRSFQSSTSSRIRIVSAHSLCPYNGFCLESGAFSPGCLLAQVHNICCNFSDNVSIQTMRAHFF